MESIVVQQEMSMIRHFTVRRDRGDIMYKVVIIDDEPIIVEGISRMIPWEKYNCRLTATANDGLEGTEVIRTYKPDILISDIAMPGLDGLAMIAGLRSEFPNMMITILTGYRDFDFAQKAIHLGVTRFLLKPSNMEELLEALSFMTKLLNERNMNDDDPKIPTEETDSVYNSFIVNNAINYIESNFSEKLTLSEVAAKTYVSQWHLSKLLNKHTEKSFSEILNNIRISKAKEMLRNPSLRIGDIAESVGFIDIAHFSKVFKKIAGVSANEYRNSLEKGDINI